MTKARDILIALAIEFNGDWNKIYETIQNKKGDDILKKYDDFDFDNVNCITLLDDAYPKVLQSSYKPPFVLFYKGDISLLNTDIVAILGTRKPKLNSEYFVDNFVSKIDGKTILTTLTKGIASRATNVALKYDKKVIAVLANGIDSCYPDTNKELYDGIIAANGLILSEYYSNVSPTSENFWVRSRIVAALSNKICSIEMNEHSGTLLTITEALQLGKEIYCLPDTLDKLSVNNRLIDEGANCLTLATQF